MAEKSKRRNDKDIPIKIDGVTRFVKNVTNGTTCADVIKMILKKLNIGKENLAYYAIFESAKGIDRPLAGKTRILKTVRSWGSDTSYKLVFRKSAPAVTYIPRLSEANREKLSQWSKSSTSSSSDGEETYKEKYLKGLEERMKTPKQYRISDRELSRQLFADDYSDDTDSMDEFMSKVDSRKLNDFWDFCNAITESEIKRLSKGGPNKPEIAPAGVSRNKGTANNIKYAVKKRLKQFKSSNRIDELGGKTELMQKYLCDCSSYDTSNIGKMKKVLHRDHKCNVENSRCLNKNEQLEESPLASYHANRFYWSVHGESDAEETSNTSSSLQEAFINDCSISDNTNDSGIKMKRTANEKMHALTPFSGRKLVNYSLSEDESEDLHTKSFDFHKLWDSGNVYDEDDEMESFMKTKIHEDLSDEGLSSMGSDEEREILV